MTTIERHCGGTLQYHAEEIRHKMSCDALVARLSLYYALIHHEAPCEIERGNLLGALGVTHEQIARAVPFLSSDQFKDLNLNRPENYAQGSFLPERIYGLTSDGQVAYFTGSVFNAKTAEALREEIETAKQRTAKIYGNNPKKCRAHTTELNKLLRKLALIVKK